MVSRYLQRRKKTQIYTPEIARINKLTITIIVSSTNELCCEKTKKTEHRILF